MSEEMKLITALCEALGFEVEVKRDYDERKVTGTEASRINSVIQYPDAIGRALKGAGGVFQKDDQGLYTSVLIEPIISYKLTRRQAG